MENFSEDVPLAFATRVGFDTVLIFVAASERTGAKLRFCLVGTTALEQHRSCGPSALWNKQGQDFDFVP